ncbi:MAG: hypothetical protein H8M99_01210 [Gloeobacteraceae cyanobacterium ES-bin-144]|nr:hypothetical protein [Verrucomicrobiales bacterium]
MRQSAAVLILLMAGSAAATRTDYLNAQRKFKAIETQQTKPGTRVEISSQELNAYVEHELPQVAPPGIRKPHVVLLGGNKASGAALIDFVKMRSARGQTTNWVLRKLLQGEREVTVTARIRSGNGSATVDVERVEVAGLPIQGAALDFLIQNYLLPNYPQVKIGKPFGLHRRIDRVEVVPGMAYVVLKR